ncbi:MULTISPECIES: IS66 family insertion sequence element accessory protein TnpB [Roseateles]|uniref:IS66 family insertion sequence element accessory protein TnpB n=1 Tax=Pelomonas caseinilytica TaxID=2906763 RepID=A0ABS8XLU9_9BURK|nr:IS66 family insertion sequence element accessory protein TnpB [Roseateles sp.]MCE4540577.1 IS66 family insertion sequence element accessory protein TnpB [Pelomonas sp. P7]HEV6967994.1 IS66 family insertion sequence element accessory protein TnpB [Roseateles sp.]
MILSSAVRAFVCTEPVDMRKSIDGLSQIVAAAMGMNPLSGQVFVFIGRRRDRAKLLVWDRHGFWVLYKRLERGRFTDPARLAANGIAMSELVAWLEGIDLSRVRRLSPLEVSTVA